MDKGGCGDYLTNDLLCSFQGRAVNVLTSAVGFFFYYHRAFVEFAPYYFYEVPKFSVGLHIDWIL